MRSLAWRLGVLTGLLIMAALMADSAQAQYAPAPANKSWTDSITVPIKSGFNRIGQGISPKPPAPNPNPQDDAVSLSGSGRPGPELYVALARVYQQGGKLAAAEEQYQAALRLKPNDLTALLGLAQLKEQMGKPDEALQVYGRAAGMHPRQPAVHNNAGMCCARRNRLDEAAAAMRRAVELDPKNKLYRNNLATVLVDQGKPTEALTQLQAVHEEATAYYNLGYLLHKKGDSPAALQHFTLALQADPAMDAARRWVEHLSRRNAQARLLRQPIGSGMRDAEPAGSPTAANTRRLPPIMDIHGNLDESVPSDVARRPVAPLPPATNSALRPLPKVR